MNTEDYKSFDICFADIFKEQKKILIKYEPELKERIKDFDINVLEDQLLIKDFLLTRMVEELTEAYEALIKKETEHFYEEIIDAFNFLVEAYCIYGWDYSKLDKWRFYGEVLMVSDDSVRQDLMKIIYSAGMVCNCLKNRSWRQSQYLVDLKIFEKRFKTVWVMFNQFCENISFNEKELQKWWSLKYQVNDFRLETKY